PDRTTAHTSRSARSNAARTDSEPPPTVRPSFTPVPPRSRRPVVGHGVSRRASRSPRRRRPAPQPSRGRAEPAKASSVETRSTARARQRAPRTCTSPRTRTHTDRRPVAAPRPPPLEGPPSLSVAVPCPCLVNGLARHFFTEPFAGGVETDTVGVPSRPKEPHFCRLGPRRRL